jgi:hypothetical protein
MWRTRSSTDARAKRDVRLQFRRQRAHQVAALSEPTANAIIDNFIELRGF